MLLMSPGIPILMAAVAMARRAVRARRTYMATFASPFTWSSFGMRSFRMEKSCSMALFFP